MSILMKLTEKINNVSKRSKKLCLVIVIVLAILIIAWLTSNNGKMLSSVLTLSALIMLILFVLHQQSVMEFFRHYSAQLTPSNAQAGRSLLERLVAMLQQLKTNCIRCMNRLYDFFKYFLARKQLKNKPWYLVLGKAQSGKNNVINSFGLDCLTEQQLSTAAKSYIERCPDVNWTFANQALFLDVMGDDEQQNKQSWTSIQQLLSNERKSFNGIIIVISIIDLIANPEQQVKKLATHISQTINDLHTSTNEPIPIYTLFNQCDLITGFESFFKCFPEQEFAKPCGITFSLNDSKQSSQTIQQFFSQLTQQFSCRILWMINDAACLKQREQIIEFPQQIQALQQAIDRWLKDLIAATNAAQAIHVRGLYFINGKQSFNSRLFLDVILPDTVRLGDGRHANRRNKQKKLITQLVIPLAVVYLGYATYLAYSKNQTDIKQLTHLLSNYQARPNRSQDLVLATLPQLESLYVVDQLVQTSTRLYPHLLFVPGQIKRSIEQAQQRVLQKQFLPRIAAQLEKQLSSKSQNKTLLYLTLKAYLAFSQTINLSRDVITTPIKYDWQQRYVHQPLIRQRLNRYLQQALQWDVTKLPLDQPLIRRVYLKLSTMTPLQRAYALLEMESVNSVLPAIHLNTMVGKAIHDKPLSSKLIPALYTKHGYQALFLHRYLKLARQTLNDDNDMGLPQPTALQLTPEQLAAAMKQYYFKRYGYYWHQALREIHIAHFKDLQEAIDNLAVLTSKSSPLMKALKVIASNTEWLDKPEFQLQQVIQFYQSHHYTNLLIELHDYFDKRQHSVKPNKALYQAALDIVSGNENPIQQIENAALKAPQPIKRYLQTIANNAWQVVARGAIQWLNHLWQTQVLSFYDDQLRDRYPFSQSGHQQMTINDFKRMFAQNGIMNTFFNKHLRSFIDTDNNIWQVQKTQDHSLPLSNKLITLFQTAKRIRQDFFHDNEHLSRLRYSIKPLTLDAQVARITLQLAGKTLIYRHGKPFFQPFSWPTDIEAQQASLSLVTFSGQHYGFTETGPWSLFKFFQHGKLSATQNPEESVFSIIIDGHHASFILKTELDDRILTLADIKHFQLPQSMT